jgi:hypothetical protein
MLVCGIEFSYLFKCLSSDGLAVSIALSVNFFDRIVMLKLALLQGSVNTCNLL